MEGFANYSGPNPTIWSDGDGDCRNLRNMSGSLDECKSACDNTPGCTVINFVDDISIGTRCSLRACSTGKEPSWNVSPFVGYSKYYTIANPAPATLPAPVRTTTPTPAPMDKDTLISLKINTIDGKLGQKLILSNEIRTLETELENLGVYKKYHITNRLTSELRTLERELENLGVYVNDLRESKKK